MNVITGAAVDILLHNLKRFAGVILIGLLLIGGPYLIYRKGYNQGFTKGYARAIIDRPTYGNVDTVINQQPDRDKTLGLIFYIWKLKLRLEI